ncbi:MAG: tol-pal system protein YbgF [Gammaproteobacteria bacterium]|nr:tol-pal system protein YbgF [Gammaproteobacteria bacterium]
MLPKQTAQQALGLLIICSLFLSLPASIHAAGNKGSLDSRVERLERRISRLSELMMQVDALKRENSELRGQIELQNHTINSLKNRQRDLYIDIDQRLTQLQASGQKPATTTVAPTVTDFSAAAPKTPVAEISKPAPVSAVPAPVVLSTRISKQEQAAYDKANRLLISADRRYPEAIKAFQAFLKKYPQSKLAGNAQYWLAEAFYVSQKNNEALLEFSKVIQLYPASTKVPGAMLKTGYLHHSSGRIAEARDILNKIISRYPKSSEAALAKQRLSRIQKIN